jgi:hypothetical protein
MEAQYVNIAFLLILNIGAITGTGSAVHPCTKHGQSLVENFLGHKGNKQLFQALAVEQAITQPMW